MLPILLLMLACDGSQGRIADVSEEGEVLASADTPEGRVRAALTGVRQARAHEIILADFEKYGDGKILVDAPEKVTNLPAERVVGGLLDDPAFASLLAGDEEAAAAALRDKDVRFVLLRRDILPSVDRGRVVLNRLYHDDFRMYFELRAVDDRFLLYKVLSKPRDFPRGQAELAAGQLRKLLKGEKVERVKPIKTDDGMRWNLVGVLREPGGRELAFGECLADELQLCVDRLAGELETFHRRYAEWYGFAPVADEIDGMIVELHRLTERAEVASRSEESLDAMWEMGIDGAAIHDTAGELATRRVAFFPGSMAYTRAYRATDQMMRHAASEYRLGSRRPWREADNRLEKFRDVHYMSYPDGRTVHLFRGVPLIPLQLVDLDVLEQSLVMASEWYMTNMAPDVHLPPNLPYDDGQVTYKFWPAENRYSNEYNLVRHTLATWNLVQGWTIEPRDEFLEGSRRALDWTLKYRKDEGDMSFIDYKNNRKLGSVVVGLLGIIDLARATESDEFDELMERFGNFTLFMQEESGKFDPYYVDDDHPYADETNDIVPGEALLALMSLYEYTGDKKWLKPAEKYYDYYIPWWNERVVKKSEDGAWPAYIYDNQTRLDLVQFGPWTVMASNAYHRITGDERAAKFALEVARWMIDSYAWTSERSPWPDYVGGYYKMEGELPAMQAFCYAEGTAAAYDLALRYKPDEAPYFEQATRESARFALQMQGSEEQLYAFPRGELARGGTRYAMNETKIRIDYVYHAFSAVYQYIQAARRDPNLPPEVKRSPLRDLMPNIPLPGGPKESEARE